jgi:hypothetical protein
MEEKKLNIKFFDRSKNILKTLQNTVSRSDVGFSSQINGGQGEFNLQLSLPFDDFEEYSTSIQIGNIVEVRMSDENNQLGRLIYTGQITQYRAFDEQFGGVTLVLSGLVNIFTRGIFRTGSTVTRAYTATDVATIVRDVISQVNTEYGNFFSHTAQSIPDTGVSVDVTFESTTWFEAIQKCIELAGANYYWYVGADGVLFFKEYSTTSDHAFDTNRDISQITKEEDGERIVNSVSFVYNGGIENVQDAASITANGLRHIVISDDGVGNSTEANRIASERIAKDKNPLARITMGIKNTADLEAIKVGDTCNVLGYSSGVLPAVMRIQSISYTPEQIQVQIGEYRTLTNRLVDLILNTR